MKIYLVKTRNWKGTQRALKLISLAPFTDKWPKIEDGDKDIKFYYESNSLIKSLAVWLYWRIVRKWSGGWTYIVNQRKDYNLSSYKSFYL